MRVDGKEAEAVHSSNSNSWEWRLNQGCASPMLMMAWVALGLLPPSQTKCQYLSDRQAPQAPVAKAQPNRTAPARSPVTHRSRRRRGRELPQP